MPQTAKTQKTSFQRTFVWPKGWGRVGTSVSVILSLALPMNDVVLAEDPSPLRTEVIVQQAKDAWVGGNSAVALEILTQGIQEHSNALNLEKLHGDILATTRQDQEAVEAYDAILQRTPEALDIRWAKWSVLYRSGKEEEAIDEFKRIAELDSDNPLVPLRMAHDLRILDRLEESLEWYQKAVALAPNFPGWWLAMARARFDVLDGRGARDDVKHVLTMVAPGSPEEAAAHSLLSVVYGATKERGRRFQPIFSPGKTAADQKEWASIRAEGWRLYSAGRYREAEPILQRIIVLNPSDFAATHNLGITLMELERYEEAIPVLEKVLTLTLKEEVLADTFFRLGQSKAALERWAEALDHFQILYETAVEFEESNKDVAIKPGIRVLSKEKLASWIEKVRPYVPEAEHPQAQEPTQAIPPSKPSVLNEEEVYEKVATEKLKPQDPLYRRALLMGRDADFGTFRYVIPAKDVLRDNLPIGNHEFIPIDPGDTFPSTQPEIFLVFELLSASFDEMPLTVECFLETAHMTKSQRAAAQDQVIISMNEQSGYFVLSKPEADWTSGLYRCGLYVGEEISANTHTDEVRFRIIAPTVSS
ncbi:tetratricopeptide repeat protein [Nitrospira sp. M1]